MTKRDKNNESLQDEVFLDVMEVLIPTHENCSSAIESDEGRGQAAPLPTSTKSKMRDGSLVDCGMYAKSLRSLRKGSNGAGDDAPNFVTPQR